MIGFIGIMSLKVTKARTETVAALPTFASYFAENMANINIFREACDRKGDYHPCPPKL
jgi:hypothetical protein